MLSKFEKRELLMKKTKTIAIATAIVTLLSASAAFAATTSSSSAQSPRLSQRQSWDVKNGGFNRGSKDGLKTELNSLVTAGTITQEQADAITTAISTAEKGPDGMKTALDALVTAGTITQAQEDALTAGRGQGHNGAHRFGK